MDIQRFLQKQVSRKTFFVYVGMFFVSILGISEVIQRISNISPEKKKLPENNGPLFSAGPYGGTQII